MGVRAILQRGRTHPLIVMPADAVDKINAQRVKATEPIEAEEPAPTDAVVDEPLAQESVSIEPPVEQPTAPEPVEELVVAPADQPVVVETSVVEVEPKPTKPENKSVSGITATLSVKRGPGAPELPNEPASVSLFEEDQVRRGDDFTTLPGVGRAIARRLKAAGFRTFEDVANGDEQKLQRLLGTKFDDVLAAAKEQL